MSSVTLTCDTQNENKINRLTFVVRRTLYNSHSSGLKQWRLVWDRCEMLPIDNLSPKLHRRFCAIYTLIYPIARLTSGNLFLKMVLFSMSISVAQ